MKAIYCISADALTKMQTVNAHAFEVGSMCKKIEAVWSSYDDFVDFFTEEIGIAPTIFHLIDCSLPIQRDVVRLLKEEPKRRCCGSRKRRTPVYGSCLGVHRPGMCVEA